MTISMEKVSYYSFLVILLVINFLHFIPWNLTSYNPSSYFLWISSAFIFLLTFFYPNNQVKFSKLKIISATLFFTVFFVNIFYRQLIISNWKFFITNPSIVYSLLNTLSYIFILISSLRIINTDRKFTSVYFALLISSTILGIFNIFAIDTNNFLSLTPTQIFQSKQLLTQLISYIFCLNFLLIPIFFSILKSSTYSLFKKIAVSITLIFNTIIFCYLFYQSFFLPKNFQPLPIKYALPITYQTIVKSPFIGTGPLNFENTFNLNKPLTFNEDNLWETIFKSNNNEFLEIATSTSLPGLFCLILLVITQFIQIKNKKIAISLILVIFSSLIIKFSTPISLLFFMLLGLNLISSQGLERKKSNKFTFSLSVILLIIIFAGTISITISDIYYQSSVKINSAKKTYERQKLAISFFPYNDNYHKSLSQSSLLFADALVSSNISEGSKTLSSENKILFNKLLSQTISEAKVANTINISSENLLNLGLIYKNIGEINKESFQLALSAYYQASQLNPNNPKIQQEIGHIYFLQKDYSNALKYFKNASVLKKEYSPSYYFQALCQSKLQNFDEAKKNLTIALKFTPLGSKDYLKIQSELEKLK